MGFISTKGSVNNRREYIRAIRNLAKANIEYYSKFYEMAIQVKFPKKKIKFAPTTISPKDVKLLIQNAKQLYK